MAEIVATNVVASRPPDGDRLQRRGSCQYQSSGAGGTRSPPAMPHRLQHLPAHFIQNGRWGPGIGQTLGYWTL